MLHHVSTPVVAIMVRKTPFVVREREFLHNLHRRKNKPKSLQNTIRNASSGQIRAIYEVVGNGVRNPHVARLHLNNLQQIKRRGQHKYFREFLNKKTTVKRRKRLLNQHGNGIFSTALKLLPMALNLFTGGSNKQAAPPPPPRYYYYPPPPPPPRRSRASS